MLCRSACTRWGIIVCECDPLHLPQSEAHLQRSVAFLGDLRAIWSHLGPSEANLKPSWGQLGAILGPSWAYLGLSSRHKNLDFPMVFLTFYDICASSTILTRSCFIVRDLKPIFSDQKPFFGELEAIWSHLGPSEANLKPAWGHLGPIVGPS